MSELVFETRNDKSESARQLDFANKLKEIVQKLSETKGRKITAHIETFGCQMNARDSEKLLGILKIAGFEEVDTENADLVIYNTCSVRDNANQKVYGHLGRLKNLKKSNPDMKIAMCGCMTQEISVIDKITESYSFVNLIFGTHNIYKFAELLYYVYTDYKDFGAFDSDTTYWNKNTLISHWDATTKICEDLPISRKFLYKSGVNIMFGCNNFCSYCIVPYVRGRERSREPEEIIEEIKGLVADGVIEVMLLGQNVNSYGKNLENPVSFAELLKRIEEIEGLKRIRFMTSHPKDLSDELIEVMKNSKKICKHLHLPLQSGSTKILTAMNRRYTKESYLELAAKIKREIPDISLTTDIIVGFPGETEEDIEDTLDVIRQVQYDNAFTFIYSIRTGTPAGDMEQLPEEFVKEQFDKVLSLVQETARNRVSRFEGQTMEALVEEINDHDDTLVSGRLSNNTIVHFPGDASLIGKLVNVKLLECKGFYYIGEMV